MDALQLRPVRRLGTRLTGLHGGNLAALRGKLAERVLRYAHDSPWADHRCRICFTCVALGWIEHSPAGTAPLASTNNGATLPYRGLTWSDSRDTRSAWTFVERCQFIGVRDWV